MMVYLADGTIDFGANSIVNLLGSDETSSYKGILFFGSRTAPNHNGQGGNKAHSLGGGAGMALQGSIYLTQTTASMIATPGTYQTLLLGGGAGTGTAVRGQIIVDSLQLGGGGSIVMNLSPNPIFSVPQVALVN